MLWLIEYESAHWAGATSDCVVKAENKEDAVCFAEEFMNNEMLELYFDEYEDEAQNSEEAPLYDNEATFVVVSCEKFDEKHKYWKYKDSEYFPMVD